MESNPRRYVHAHDALARLTSGADDHPAAPIDVGDAIALLDVTNATMQYKRRKQLKKEESDLVSDQELVNAQLREFRIVAETASTPVNDVGINQQLRQMQAAILQQTETMLQRMETASNQRLGRMEAAIAQQTVAMLEMGAQQTVATQEMGAQQTVAMQQMETAILQQTETMLQRVEDRIGGIEDRIGGIDGVMARQIEDTQQMKDQLIVMEDRIEHIIRRLGGEYQQIDVGDQIGGINQRLGEMKQMGADINHQLGVMKQMGAALLQQIKSNHAGILQLRYNDAAMETARNWNRHYHHDNQIRPVPNHRGILPADENVWFPQNTIDIVECDGNDLEILIRFYDGNVDGTIDEQRIHLRELLGIFL